MSLYSIEYRVHVQNIGWQEWKTDGELAGTEGKNLRLEAIRIELTGTKKYEIQYRFELRPWRKFRLIHNRNGRKRYSAHHKR
mgnify:CR=1 FL=1